jgi:cell division protein FtsB
MSADKIAVLEEEFKQIDDENKVYASEVKALTNGEYIRTNLCNFIFCMGWQN